MAHANTEALVRLIESELERLDAGSGCTNGNGIVVYADDDLPDGWVRLADDYASAYGEAAAVLDAVRNTQPEDGTDDDGNPDGWAAVWAALDGKEPELICDRRPESAAIWNDYHEFVRGVDLPGGLGLIVVRTNGGLRYGFAPRGSDYSAFNATHDFSEWYAEASDAIDAAGAFEAERAAVREPA